jgi:hypothetical protein
MSLYRLMGLSGGLHRSDRLEWWRHVLPGGMDPAAAGGPTSTALGSSAVVGKLGISRMHAAKQATSGADDAPLDAWLRQALRQTFGGTLAEPLPSDLLAVAAGRPQLRASPMAGGTEPWLVRAGEV